MPADFIDISPFSSLRRFDAIFFAAYFDIYFRLFSFFDCRQRHCRR
jgi:hypothetical protein